MKTALLLLFTGAVAVSFMGCTSCESYARKGYDFYQVDKIAVVDVVGPVGGEAAKNQIADMFVMELLKKGYSPIERAGPGAAEGTKVSGFGRDECRKHCPSR